MTAAIKLERLVVQFAARLVKHDGYVPGSSDNPDYPAEHERLVTPQELALLTR